MTQCTFVPGLSVANSAPPLNLWRHPSMSMHWPSDRPRGTEHREISCLSTRSCSRESYARHFATAKH